MAPAAAGAIFGDSRGYNLNKNYYVFVQIIIELIMLISYKCYVLIAIAEWRMEGTGKKIKI